MKYLGADLRVATNAAIDRLTEIGGEGGLIAADREGNIAMPFNSEGMYRGFVSNGSEIVIEIYR
jgi:beta-aspartyl-peptidase (threonine type)